MQKRWHDWRFLREAVELAQKGAGHTRPNPPVGAVLVKGRGIIGRGWHARCGSDHAEVAAIKDAMSRHTANDLKGATLYVTLEPCSKPGRVGACTDAIIAAGIKHVFWMCPDPNPQNHGRATRILRKAGIECECITDIGWSTDNPLAAAKRLIDPFAKHITTGLPYVIVKIAMSLDGKICDDFGHARWISSEDARKKTGCLREVADVVLVGAETIRRDNPSLLCHTKPNDDLWRAVVSKSGHLPQEAQVFTDAANDRTLVYNDAVEAIHDLGKRGFLTVLCEGGLKLATALAEAGLVDLWITVLSKKVIGAHPIDQAIPIKSLLCLPD